MFRLAIIEEIKSIVPNLKLDAYECDKITANMLKLYLNFIIMLSKIRYL